MVVYTREHVVLVSGSLHLPTVFNIFLRCRLMYSCQGCMGYIHPKLFTIPHEGISPYRRGAPYINLFLTNRISVLFDVTRVSTLAAIGAAL